VGGGEREGRRGDGIAKEGRKGRGRDEEWKDGDNGYWMELMLAK
jgi:hypothetical protein